MRQFVWHEADSFLHRLNPLTKLALTIPVAVLVVAASDEPLTPLVIAAVATAASTWRLGTSAARKHRSTARARAAARVRDVLDGRALLRRPGRRTRPPVVPGPIHITEASLVYGLTMMSRTLAIFATSRCSC